MTGSTISRITRACERRIKQRTRRKRAHAAGIRSTIVVEDTFVILGGADRQRARAVADEEEGDFGARQTFLDDESFCPPHRIARRSWRR